MPFYIILLYKQVDGINLLQMPARDTAAYGRSLLDVLFTKEEQGSCVILTTKKSIKPPLSPRRVQKLFGMHYYEYIAVKYCLFFLLDCVKIKYPNYEQGSHGLTWAEIP